MANHQTDADLERVLRERRERAVFVRDMATHHYFNAALTDEDKAFLDSARIDAMGLGVTR